MSHTPGPWRVGGIKGTVYTDDAVFLARAESGEHGDWLRGNPFGNGVCEANARLIAAAPELLAALKEIINGDPAGGTYSGSQCVAIAEAAIAKAEGK